MPGRLHDADVLAKFGRPACDLLPQWCAKSEVLGCAMHKVRAMRASKLGAVRKAVEYENDHGLRGFGLAIPN